MQNKIEIYQNNNGEIEFKGDLIQETIWASLDQIAQLFNKDKSGISRHIKNIFNSGELDRNQTVAKIATVQTEGNKKVQRDIEYFKVYFLKVLSIRKGLILLTLEARLSESKGQFEGQF